MFVRSFVSQSRLPIVPISLFTLHPSLCSMYTRRSFLRTTALGGSFAATLPSFLAGTFDALAGDATGSSIQTVTGKDAPILVVLQLAGGNDGLNTVVPYANDDYFRARPKLGLSAKDVLRLDHQFGLHPALKGFQALSASGHLSIVHGVGYPNPNRSHFRSTEIWATASDSQKVERHGWIGRYFDHACPGADPAVGVALSRTMPQAFAAKSPTGVSLENPESYRYVDPDEPETGAMATGGKYYRQMNQDVGLAGGSIQSLGSGRMTVDDPRAFLERTALDAQISSDTIRTVAAQVKNHVPYPATALASNLNLVAQLIAGGLATRVFYLNQGGFDTHTNQAAAHPRLLTELGGALQAFVADLKALGQLDRVLVLTFSEFGRRVAENQSGGTDHGAGAPMFLLGGKVKPGFHGETPSLEPKDLFNGDVKFHTDFRSIYAGVLEHWLRTKSEPILGRHFEPLRLVA